jgi:hypothetical protein
MERVIMAIESLAGLAKISPEQLFELYQGGFCPLGWLIARMPWNQAGRSEACRLPF